MDHQNFAEFDYAGWLDFVRSPTDRLLGAGPNLWFANITLRQEMPMPQTFSECADSPCSVDCSRA